MKIGPLKSMVFPKLGSTDGVPEDKKIAVARWFCQGRGTWYAVEGEPIEGAHTRTGEQDWEFFGYVISPLGDDCDEWGYFHLGEFPVHPAGIGGGGIERDLHWKPLPIPELKKKGGQS